MPPESCGSIHPAYGTPCAHAKGHAGAHSSPCAHSNPMCPECFAGIREIAGWFYGRGLSKSSVGVKANCAQAGHRERGAARAAECHTCRDATDNGHPEPCVGCGDTIAYCSCVPGYCRACAHDPCWMKLDAPMVVEPEAGGLLAAKALLITVEAASESDEARLTRAMGVLERVADEQRASADLLAAREHEIERLRGELVRRDGEIVRLTEQRDDLLKRSEHCERHHADSEYQPRAEAAERSLAIAQKALAAVASHRDDLFGRCIDLEKDRDLWRTRFSQIDGKFEVIDCERVELINRVNTLDSLVRTRDEQLGAAIDATETLRVALRQALNESGCDGDLCAHRWHDAAREAIAKTEGR